MGKVSDVKAPLLSTFFLKDYSVKQGKGFMQVTYRAKKSKTLNVNRLKFATRICGWELSSVRIRIRATGSNLS